MKNTLTIANNLREKIAKNLTTITLIAVALFAALFFFPANISPSAYQAKHIFLASILFIYFAAQLLYLQRSYIFTSIDFWWGALFVYTILSAFWSGSVSVSIEQGFHVLVFYLVFKAFENISWEVDLTRKLFYIISLVTYSLLVLFQLIYIFQNDLLGNQPIYGNGIIHFVPCILSVIILPFVIFTKENISNYLVAFLIVVNLLTAYLLEMPQAVIVLMLLTITYTLFKLTYIQRIKYYILFGFIALLGFSLYYTVSTQNDIQNLEVLNPVEFKSAVYLSDVDHTLKQIGNSSIIGHGSGSLSSLSNYSNQTQNTFHYPNNAILALVSELGILGLIILCYISLFPILRIFNERNILSTVELASIVSVSLFFFLSLFYGETYGQPSYFANAPLIAVICLALISKKANANTLISETSNKMASVILLCLALGSLVCYLN